MTCSRLWLAGVLALLFGCDQSPSDLREWKPSDHEPGDRPSQTRPSPAKPRGHPSGPGSGVAPGVFAAWSMHCVSCHGIVGRGDGPQGKKSGATDLSDPKWQDSAPDARISQVIGQGRGQMPAFELDPPTVQGLTQLIRRMRSDPPGPPADAGPPHSGVPTNAKSSG